MVNAMAVIRRAGKFEIHWKVIQDNPAGVVSALRDILIISAVNVDGADMVSYVGIAQDEQFDKVDIDTSPPTLPYYDLKMGLNHDGTHHHRWIKRK